MNHYFKSHGYVPGGIVTNARNENLDLEIMPAFLRTLLVTDGTVTKALESYFWEPVCVDDVIQKQVWLTEDQPILGCTAGEHVLKRDVTLVGQKSHDVYAYAVSYMKLEHLPEDIRNNLLDGNIGIGELLREKGLETYREIMDMGREFQPESINPSHGTPSGELIYRTYRIVLNGTPTIQVTEKFPYHLFANKCGR